MDERMIDALNGQIKEELYSSYLYLSMSSYFEINDLKGFANWMRIQTQEELAHAMRIYNFLNERGAKVKLESIGAPLNDWESPLKVFEDTLAHEKHITGCINKLVDLAMELRDHSSMSFLNWFLDEQVEEESAANEIVKKLELAGKDGAALLMLDRESGQRVFVNTFFNNKSKEQ